MYLRPRFLVLFAAIVAIMPNEFPATASTSSSCAALDKQDPDDRQFYGDNATYDDLTNDSKSWVLTDPVEEGIDFNNLLKAATDLGKRPEQFSFIVARNGKPVFEIDPESRAGEDYLAVTKEILHRLKTPM